MSTHRAGVGWKWIGAAVCAGLLFAVAAHAQPAPGATPRTGEPRRLAPREPDKKKDDKRQVRINHADRARYDSARGLFYLFGKVQMSDEDMKLYCDEATYNENDDTAACAGNLKIIDGENVITGNLINADFEAEIINIEGSVKIVTTKTLKSQEEEEEEKRITTITCDKIVYTYTEGRRFALATGNLKAVQKDKTVIAEKAEYDREQDIITLSSPGSGSVVIKMDNGNEFTVAKVIISVTEDWIDMEGGLAGIIFRDDKKEDQPPAPPQ